LFHGISNKYILWAYGLYETGEKYNDDQREW